jgi:hypothetical protein
MASAAAHWNGRANLYFTLNPANPVPPGWAANRIQEKAESISSDTNITCRRWPFIDLDPVQPSSVSSTEAERQAVREVPEQVVTILSGLGCQNLS